MIRTQVYFEERQKRELMSLAAKKKMKFSLVLREIIDAGLKNELNVFRKRASRDEVLKKFIGFDKSKGGRSMSRDIDKILYIEPYE